MVHANRADLCGIFLYTLFFGLVCFRVQPFLVDWRSLSSTDVIKLCFHVCLALSALLEIGERQQREEGARRESHNMYAGTCSAILVLSPSLLLMYQERLEYEQIVSLAARPPSRTGMCAVDYATEIAFSGSVISGYGCHLVGLWLSLVAFSLVIVLWSNTLNPPSRCVRQRVVDNCCHTVHFGNLEGRRTRKRS